MAMHSLVQDIVNAYLSLADAEAPGLVQGLYLTGSVALSDFHPEASDMDFVAVTSAVYDAAGVAALERVYARLAARYRRPFFDGPCMTWDQLAHNPLHTAPGPCAHEGHVQPRVNHDRHPVTWHTLAQHGITVRGSQRQA